MTTAKQAALVLRLYQKTLEGKLDWKPAVATDSFQVSFSNYSVQLRPINRENAIDYSIEVFNSDGEVADSFTDVDIVFAAGAPVNSKPRQNAPASPSWYQSMKALHALARRSALGADKALDSILTDLDGV